MKFEGLHKTYAKKGLLDPNAAVYSGSEIIVHAPVEIVWKIVYNIKDWTAFYPDFGKFRIDNNTKIEPDVWFSFRLNKFPIKAKFAVVEAKKIVCWTGKSLWTKAIDKITLTPTSDNKTLLRIEESFSGFLVTIFVNQKQLEKQHKKWLTAIKNESEKTISLNR